MFRARRAASSACEPASCGRRRSASGSSACGSTVAAPSFRPSPTVPPGGSCSSRNTARSGFFRSRGRSSMVRRREEHMSVSADPRIGSDFLGYRIEALLGRGGMSVVYRARHTALDRNVALKLLAPELAEDARFRERFLRESKLAASLDHPSIVPVYDAGEVEGQLYIAMRYVEGSDLGQLLREEGALEPRRALLLVGQLADALDFAHGRGLVHRDVKPSNALLDLREHAYLADFGLTKTASDRSAAAVTGRIVGTVDYAAPEQIEGRPVDGRADVYSIGCLLYECLVGVVPFPRES